MDNFFVEFVKSITPGILEIGLVVLGFLVSRYAIKINEILKHKLFRKSIKNAHSIQVQLAEVRARLNADRSMIWLFHNGKNFIGEGDFHNYYLSCEFERNAHGFSEEFYNFQNIPVSGWTSILSKMIDASNTDMPIFFIGDGSPNAEFVHLTWYDCGLITFPDRLNISNLMMLKLQNSKKQFCGVVMFGFENFNYEKSMFNQTTNGIFNDDLYLTLRIFIEDLKKHF